MYDVITIGSAVVDVFVQSSSFHLRKIGGDVLLCENFGEKIEVDSFQMHTGGGATNTAVGFSRLGFQTAVIAEMGRDAQAEFIIQDLEREHVDTNVMIKEKKEHTGGSVILIGKDGGRTIMVHRGAASELSVTDLPQLQLTQARWWHLSSIAGHLAILKKLFTTAKLHHIGVSWNPGKAELALLVNGQLHPDEVEAEVMFVNQEEWSMVRTLQAELRRKIREIVVTSGDQGGVVLMGHNEQPFRAEKVTSVDDTGAGDAFATGYVAAHLTGGLTFLEATAWGIANASSVVKQIGAKPGLLSMSQLETMTGTG